MITNSRIKFIINFKYLAFIDKFCNICTYVRCTYIGVDYHHNYLYVDVHQYYVQLDCLTSLLF